MNQLRIPVTGEDHSMGPEDAPITLVEYGDYQCSHCAEVHSKIKHIVTKAMPGEIRFVFRNFPLSQMHTHAFTGALAAEAASLQNRFWDFHDSIFENQNLLSPDGIFQFAEWQDLHLEQFQEDLNKEDLKLRIHQDFMGGVRSGVNTTPTFYLNDRRYDGPIDVSSLRARIVYDDGLTPVIYL